MPWDDERISALKTLSTSGLSASQIATKLGGVSRNAVIGKLHRLGLTINGSAAPHYVRAPRAPRPNRVRKKSGRSPDRQGPAPDVPPFQKGPVPPPKKPEPPIHTHAVGIEGVKRGQCRFIVLDKPSRFCGLPTCERGSGQYCDYHAQLCYAGTSRREPYG